MENKEEILQLINIANSHIKGTELTQIDYDYCLYKYPKNTKENLKKFIREINLNGLIDEYNSWGFSTWDGAWLYSVKREDLSKNKWDALKEIYQKIKSDFPQLYNELIK